MKRYLFILLTIFLLSNSLYAQKSAIGASLIYNFQAEGYGFGVRYLIPISPAIELVPQASYFPGFNLVNEYYIGASLQLALFTSGNFKFYILGNASYNGWRNFEHFNNEFAQYSSYAIDAGAGLTYRFGCMKFFAEQRYNANWKEATHRIGLYFIIKCKKGHRGGGSRSGGGNHRCPAYN